MRTALIVLSSVLGLLFVVTGGVKVLRVRQSLRIRERLGVPPRLWPVIGCLEAAGGAGLLLGIAAPALGLAASLGLAALMTGAVAARLRAREPASAVALDVTVFALVAMPLVLHAATGS
ncbi:hypothetical protein GCM10009654_21900 [Streptomyces hebeiensis]|uniref:DoxX family protein n=1 Tax=Streptomyces hebeiensis TaxID=229486 RepID=A0ABN1US28_9ACTN